MEASTYIPRDSYEKADALVVVAASIPIKETMFLSIYYLLASSIATDQVSQIDKASFSWLIPIIHYFSLGELLDNRVETHKIQVHATRFSLVKGQLYKRSLDGPYLNCLTPQQG